MRLTTAIWLGVFMRTESARGAYVTVARRGAQQAGAAFVIHRHSEQDCDVYSPAPQSMFEEAGSDRLFECVQKGVSVDEAQAYLDKQYQFDPDIWVIETESGSGEITLSQSSQS